MNDNKTFVIIGASSEIGREISLKLASEGFNLLLTYNESLQKIIDLEKEIQKKFKINLLKNKLNLLSDNFIQLKETI